MNKMSDVFGDSINEDTRLRLQSTIALSGPEAEAAIHAIGNHDKLTERVNVLETALRNLVDLALSSLLLTT